MNKANFALASGLVSATYVQQGEQAMAVRSSLVTTLMSQRKLPLNGWDDMTIEMFLQVSCNCIVVWKLLRVRMYCQQEPVELARASQPLHVLA